MTKENEEFNAEHYKAMVKILCTIHDERHNLIPDSVEKEVIDRVNTLYTNNIFAAREEWMAWNERENEKLIAEAEKKHKEGQEMAFKNEIDETMGRC